MYVASYLQRISVTGTDLRPDRETLFRLQHAHLFHIPFEDLDIQWRIPIVLDTKRFYNKVVLNSRGGYCYELNGLFAELLLHTGFEVSMISGRVFNGRKIGAEFDHLALLVTLDEQQWLVDVGFGDFSLQPLQLNGEVQSDGRNHYRIGHTMLDGKAYLTAEKWHAGRKEFVAEYAFTTQAYVLGDFAGMNNYQQQDPASHFMQNLLCSIPVPGGRVSMINNRMVVTLNGQRSEQSIGDEQQRAGLLQEYFGIQHALLVK